MLKKQLATQVDSLEHESKARAQLQEQHERQMRHFKLEVKRKLVSAPCLYTAAFPLSTSC